LKQYQPSTVFSRPRTGDVISQGALVISPFIRMKVNDTKIVTSICTLCHLTVGSSANPDALAIAEIAHNCRNRHVSSTNPRAATPPQITKDTQD
jgi:hypothetical protein